MKINVKKILNEKTVSIAFIFFCAIFTFYLSTILPDNSAPDEKMKMDICEYIAKYGKLPHGGDELVRDPIWGISYGFTPILAYMIGGLFIKLVSFFTQDIHAFYIAARLASVIFYSIFILFTIKIGKEIFSKKFYKWLFIFLIALLPQMVYIGSYINNDSFAMMSTTIIIYYWIKGIKNKWDIKSCIKLAIGLGICALSYYNAYGYILTSAILFIISEIINKTEFKEIIKKGLIIFAIAFVICGWWFIRSAIIYNGDFLGLKTTNEYSDKYAVDGYKASTRLTPLKEGLTLKEMLIDKFWIRISMKSFIGAFGYLNIVKGKNAYLLAYAIIVCGLIGFALKYFNRQNIKDIKQNKQKNLLEIIFIVNCIIVIGLSIYYSYTSDFQPQGRYIMPILLPLMYFVTSGYEIIYENILKNFIKKDKIIIALKIILYISILFIAYKFMQLLLVVY